jgi:hypothetical protein
LVAVQAVETARRTANPTLIAWSLAARATTLAADDPSEAVALLDEARRLAGLVHNQWVLNVNILAALAAAQAATGRTEEALATSLEAADRTHRAGWLMPAWLHGWSVAAALSRLGRRDLAELLVGGADAAGTARLRPAASELSDSVAADEDPHLVHLRQIGRQLSLPELVRIARGQDPIPP